MKLPITGFEDDYLIDEQGRVWSCRFRGGPTMRAMKPVEKNGYLSVALRREGKYQARYIHRLLSEAFIPNPESKPCVNHRDGNRKNNDLSNLEWVTYSENIRHRDTVLGYVYPVEKLRANLERARLTPARGAEHGMAKIDQPTAMAIYNASLVRPAPQVAAEYGVSISSVKAIRSKRNWAYMHAATSIT